MLPTSNRQRGAIPLPAANWAYPLRGQRCRSFTALWRRESSGKLNMSWHHPALYFFLCLLAGLAFLACIRSAAPKYLGGAADAQSEREFQAVFSMTSQAGKEAMIEKWMRRQGCSRSEAMCLAVEEWRRDNR